MKKLRLLLFEECDRHCPYCCNKQYDLAALPICTSYQGFDEIILTGGEPMLRPELVMHVIQDIRRETKAPIYLYTAKVDAIWAVYVLSEVDGMTVTLHEQADVPVWNRFSSLISGMHIFDFKSLWLRAFDGVVLQECRTWDWVVSAGIQPRENCPLPEGEVFMRFGETGGKP